MSEKGGRNGGRWRKMWRHQPRGLLREGISLGREKLKRKSWAAFGGPEFKAGWKADIE